MTNNKTPSRQEMIDVIYAKISRKDLSFGCRMKSKSYNGVLISIEGGDNANIMNVDYYDSISFEDINDFEIIGHPVMIGDVLSFIQEKIFYINLEKASGGPFRKKEMQFWKNNRNKLLYFWKYTEYDIDNQSEKCIEYVYDLIK